MVSLMFKSGRCFVDYRVNGRRVREVFGRTKKVAELALKDIEVKTERNEIGFTEKDTELNKIFEEFTTYGITHNSPNTQKSYKPILNNFKEFLRFKQP